MDVINLYGGPGTGKSTIAAEVFAILKHQGINAELQREWIKGPIWDGYKNTTEDQLYILAKHYREFQRFKRGGVKVVVSDAPLLLSLIYGTKEGVAFATYVIELYQRFDNFDFFLERVREWYQEEGRLQSHEEATVIDEKIRVKLGRITKFTKISGVENAAKRIAQEWIAQSASA